MRVLGGICQCVRFLTLDKVSSIVPGSGLAFTSSAQVYHGVTDKFTNDVVEVGGWSHGWEVATAQQSPSPNPQTFKELRSLRSQLECWNIG